MHTIRWVFRNKIYEVGYFDPKGCWQSDPEGDTFAEACQLASLLNGGTADYPWHSLEDAGKASKDRKEGYQIV